MKLPSFIKKPMTFLPILVYSLLFNFQKCLCASSNDVKYDITYHNKCLSSDLVLRQFLKITLKQCVKECATRRACESLNYRRQYLLCELYLEGDGVFVPNSVKTGSCVFVKKSSIYVQTLSTCDCSYMETCNFDSHTCVQQAICSSNSSLEYYKTSFENVALDKAVNPQESYDPSHVSYMVDGVYKTAMPNCTHAVTLDQNYTVDLGESYTIHALYILNRDDCCAERLTNVSIFIGESMDTLKLYVYHGPDIGTDCLLEFKYPCQGRYVKIENSNQQFLQICEFEVYATPSP